MCVLAKTTLKTYKIRGKQLYSGWSKNMADCFSSIRFQIQGLVISFF